MQGLGNTFVVFKGPLELTEAEVVSYSLQYGPTKADGLLVVSPLDARTVQMKYWNSDGSIAEMCGNGLRCVTRFTVDNHFVQPGSFSVITDAGKLDVTWGGIDENNIEVQVGKVELKGEIELEGHNFHIASVGNPHAATFVTNLDQFPVAEFGPQIENDRHFPNRTNVEFIEIIDNHTISVRTWERGSGETLACGTGMVASAAVSAAFKAIQYPMTVKVRGGNSRVWIDDEGYARMQGPALYA